MVQALRQTRQSLQELRGALSKVEEEERKLVERMQAKMAGGGETIPFEDQVGMALNDAVALDHTQLQQTLRMRQDQIRRVIKEGESKAAHLEGSLRRIRAEAVQEEWRLAVQAVVDALGIVSLAVEDAERLRKKLDAEGLGRVHASVLDLFQLEHMPVGLDPWGKVDTKRRGLSVGAYLRRAQAIGCDMSRTLPASKAKGGRA
jgi:hypothetical protein